MNGRSLAALLFGLVLGTGALAAPVPKHLFPKSEADTKPVPSVSETPRAAPLPPPPEVAPVPPEIEARLKAIRAEIAAQKKAIAEGTYIAPPLPPGTVILQTKRAQVVPLPTDPNQPPQGK
jgi:hypothetical protein